MKSIFFISMVICFFHNAQSQSVGIGTNTPSPNAALEISSSKKGVLLPRLAKDQKMAILSPGLGLMAFQNGPDSIGLHFYNGTFWEWMQGASVLDTLKWGTGGNTGTNAAKHFIGTRDNVPLTFKINNQVAGRIDTSGSVSIGRGTLTYNPGFKRLTAIGDSALYNNSFGSVSIFNGLDNTAVGEKTLFSNTTGSRNTAIGKQALYNNKTDDDNTAMGYKAMENAASDFSTAFGSMAANKLTTGDYTTAIGYNAATNTTTGAGITALGYNAGFANTTGTSNTAIGFFAGFGSGTLTNATSIGAYASVGVSNALVLGNNANVGIGTSAPVEKLQVVGNIKTDGFIMATGAGAGKLLVSDATGNASWGTPYREYQIAIPAQSFHPASGLDADTRRFRAVNEVYAGNNGVLIGNGMYESVLEAPLIIPNGAYITSIRFFVKDTNPNYELTGKMICYSHSNNSFTQTVSGGSGLSFESGTTDFSIFLSNLVNTVTGSYVIQVYSQFLFGRSNWSGLSLMSVVVTYTMDL